MSEMFTAFFTMLTRLFSAGNAAAGALENVAVWAEESTGAFTDEAREARKAKLEVLKKRTSDAKANPDKYLQDKTAPFDL